MEKRFCCQGVDPNETPTTTTVTTRDNEAVIGRALVSNAVCLQIRTRIRR